jgi:hypothetical protein
MPDKRRASGLGPWNAPKAARQAPAFRMLNSGPLSFPILDRPDRSAPNLSLTSLLGNGGVEVIPRNRVDGLFEVYGKNSLIDPA